MEKNFIKSNGNEGYINLMNTTNGKRYFAVISCESKTFKTLKGAEKFMISRGYQEEK